jgi:hypothetical protein
MKYKVVVYFKEPSIAPQTFNVDYYSHTSPVLELFNYNGNETKIKLFPLADLISIDIVQTGV